MRNMSYSITTEACRNYLKTVTRRFAWWDIQPGERIQQIEKGMGLKKGETVKKIHPIVIFGARGETLNTLLTLGDYGKLEMVREGFPEMEPKAFVDMMTKKSKKTAEDIVNRIEFRYLIDTNHHQDFWIKVPLTVAWCPSCGGQLHAHAHTWEEDQFGTWRSSEYDLQCETLPDQIINKEKQKEYAEIKNEIMAEFESNHKQESEMPYVYWLPVYDKVNVYMKNTFRFEL